LQEGGYATDPNYAQKVVAVAAEVRSLTAGNSNSSGEGFKTAAALPLTVGGGHIGLRRF
jgi:flagellum-specific peptidoglycan hydrolase FlgJ